MAARITGNSLLKPEDRVRAQRGQMSFWEYDEKGFIVAGTPERVRQRIEELATKLRVGQLITCMHMGNLPEETCAKNNYLFGTQVAPGLRSIWDEYDDPWTPTISQRLVAANAPKISLFSQSHKEADLDVHA
jgi:hypothetical protein